MADKGEKKGKKGTKDGADESGLGPLRVWVSRARALSALGAFAIAFVVASRAGLPTADAVLRGLIAAAIFSVIGWWCVLLVIQALMRATATRQRQELEAAAAAIGEQRDAEAAAAQSGAPAAAQPVPPAEPGV